MTVSSKLTRSIDVLPLPCPAPVHLKLAIPNDVYREDLRLPKAALPESGRVASGRGLSDEESLASCLGEAAEMISCCAWGDEKVTVASIRDLGPLALSPDGLHGYSRRQIEERDAWNTDLGYFDWRPAPVDPAATIAWLPVDDAFGGAAAYAPADFLFLGRRQAGDEDAVSVADSNGCAAGTDANGARLLALLELIERDATARWWYWGEEATPIDHRPALHHTALSEWLDDRTRQTRFLRLSTALSTPVVAAVSAERDGSDVALGFAAKPTWDAALTAAATEMVQMEFSLDIARIVPDASAQWRRWRQTVTTATPHLTHCFAAGTPTRASMPDQPAEEAVTLFELLQSCREHRIDVWFSDMTRAEIGVPVFRALSTALSHYKPRFGRRPPVAPAHDPETRQPLLI